MLFYYNDPCFSFEWKLIILKSFKKYNTADRISRFRSRRTTSTHHFSVLIYFDHNLF